uniref:Uncharacterized protein n=1 Tax=Plectus sambesii TaxID=2011161 RepID=A0A914UJS6_9BILA
MSATRKIESNHVNDTAERIGAVKEYNGPPCTDDLCLNGAKCEPILNDFRCRCSTGYAGKHCENRLQSDVATNPSIKLDGSTAQSYRNKITKSVTGQQSNKLTLEIRTTERNGLIWWENKGATLYGDYLAIALIDGRISLTFNLGTEKE